MSSGEPLPGEPLPGEALPGPTGPRGWLIDVFETTVAVDLGRVWVDLAAIAGVPVDDLRAAAATLARDVMAGRLPFRSALDHGLRSCGLVPSDALLDELMETDHRRMLDIALVHDDALALLARLRSAGDRVAFVSNCADNTRRFLDDIGLTGLADVLVLSAEVGAAKPDPAIYRRALEVLDVPAASATMIDDLAAYCDAAVACGMAAVHIVRTVSTAPPLDDRVAVVRSLDAVAPA